MKAIQNAVLALALGAAPLAHAQRVISISGANFQPVPIAVAAPLADPAAREDALQIDEALLFDLTACGLFKVLDRKSFLADPQEGMDLATVKLKRWADVGADTLVKVRVTRDGGRVKAEMKTITVATGKDEVTTTEVRDVKEARRLGHVFADVIYSLFTHEPGPFQSRIAFVKKTASGKDVWMADWDGHGAFPVAQGGLNILPGITPDGAGVAYTSYRRGRPDLFSQRAGGSPQLLVSAGQMATGVTYSPDGKQIAYSVANGEASQIFVANADGSSPRQVTDAPYTINTSPSWSPDGKRLAFVSNRGGSPQIYLMGAGGGDARRLTFQGTYNQTPDWSPRGDLIAFTARDERNAFDLFTVNVESGKIVRLTQDAGNNEEPSFSPNGRMIVFTSTRRGTPQLYVMNADGENQLPLSMERGSYFTPDWGPVPH
ncbi:MAG TPA: DPP IV N-terminal domain-containing protein [Myxococcaceae bacterium]|nr:DPP IV N-terminal domain-containing protein [Myxococcaceae bacterium]